MRSEATLDHLDAKAAIDAICAELDRRGKAAVAAVVDAHGETLAVIRYSGTMLSSIAVATNKAYTAARLRRPSVMVGKRIRDPEHGFDIAYYGDARYVGWGGGIPVEIDGQFVGAVGVSGLPEAEDIELAEIGVRAIGARAKAS
ncbi:MAG: heme-binding protein [Rhodospirillales bacterium]|nr:heme-binding protein [Rhodospirillales bacterium]